MLAQKGDNIGTVGTDVGKVASVDQAVGGELLFKLLQGADKSLDSESANGICST